MEVRRIDFDFREHSEAAFQCDMNVDESLVVSASMDKTIQIYDLKNGKVKKSISHNREMWACSMCPDGTTFSVGDFDGKILIFSLHGKKLGKLVGHTSIVTSLKYTPDAHFLLSSSDDKTVRIWNWKLEKEVYCLEEESTMSSLSISLDGKRIAAGGDSGALYVWDISERENETAPNLIHKFPVVEGGGGCWISSCQFTYDGDIVVGLGSKTLEDFVDLYVLDGVDGSVKAKFGGHRWLVLYMDISPDGDFLASASGDGSVRLWKLTGKTAGTSIVLTRHGGNSGACCCRFGPSGKKLLSCGSEGSVRILTLKPKAENPISPSKYDEEISFIERKLEEYERANKSLSEINKKLMNENKEKDGKLNELDGKYKTLEGKMKEQEELIVNLLNRFEKLDAKTTPGEV